MRKIVSTIILITIALIGYGQTAYDAQLFSENNYEGTARSVAMGNAFTALGGDLGGISINPAGSAVSPYSQFTLTPGLTFSASTTAGQLPPGSNTLPYFEKSYKTNQTKAGMPNIGFTFNFETGRKTGVKSFTMGFIFNRTNSWCEDVFARGTNYTTSFAAAAAATATQNIAYYNEYLPAGEQRYSDLDFISDNCYDYYSPWKDIVGYNSGIFTSYDNNGEKFIGATEILFDNGDIQQGGPLEQTYGRSVYGNKSEYLFNIGTNISDFLYLGFNLGLNTLSYDWTEYFKETAIDSYDFENVFKNNAGESHTTYFRNMMYKYSYSASGSGIFGKFGLILTPGAGLRIGAAIQTPTVNEIHEQWQESGECTYTDSDFNGNASSPVGENSYTFTSPFRANFGLAYTLGKLALISVDYELADYKGMKYDIDRYNMSNEDIDYFEAINQEIRDNYGIEHQLRIGAEFKPLSSLAVRAGYNLLTSALKGDPTSRQNIAFGLGYSSKKSFFADLACRYSFARSEYYMPYEDYQYYNDEIVNYSPEILIKTSDWKLLLTLGWRF